MTIGNAIARTAMRDPDRVALCHGEGETTYSRLNGLAARLAVWLHVQGIRQYDRVGVTVTGQFEHLVLSLALLRLGCLQITLATFDPAPTRKALVRQCGVTVLLAENATFALPEVRTIIPDIEAILSPPAMPDLSLEAPDLPAPDQNEPAVLLSSSGTTGRPKIIPLSQAMILTRSQCTWFSPDPKTVFHPSSIEFNGTKRNLLLGLSFGHSVVLNVWPEERPDEVCRRHAASEMWLSHLQAQALIDDVEASDQRCLLPEVRLVLIGSAISADFRDAAQRRLSPEIHVTYGATEYGMISIARPGQHECGNAVGHPMAGVTVEIVDSSDNAVPVGELGEIRVRGPGMADGYFEAPEQSARVFRDGWFYTRDCGRLSRDGMLLVEGRADDMMNLNSIKIFPLEIESIIAKFPGVVECAAFALPSPVHGDIPVAAVKIDSGADFAGLQKYCRSELGIRAPRKFMRVDTLPRSANGKVLRTALSRMMADRPNADAAASVPSDTQS